MKYIVVSYSGTNFDEVMEMVVNEVNQKMTLAYGGYEPLGGISVAISWCGVIDYFKVSQAMIQR